MSAAAASEPGFFSGWYFSAIRRNQARLAHPEAQPTGGSGSKQQSHGNHKAAAGGIPNYGQEGGRGARPERLLDVLQRRVPVDGQRAVIVPLHLAEQGGEGITVMMGGGGGDRGANTRPI